MCLGGWVGQMEQERSLLGAVHEFPAQVWEAWNPHMAQSQLCPQQQPVCMANSLRCTEDQRTWLLFLGEGRAVCSGDALLALRCCQVTGPGENAIPAHCTCALVCHHAVKAPAVLLTLGRGQDFIQKYTYLSFEKELKERGLALLSGVCQWLDS